MAAMGTSDLEYCIFALRRQGARAPMLFDKLRLWATEGKALPGGRKLTPEIVEQSIKAFQEAQAASAPSTETTAAPGAAPSQEAPAVSSKEVSEAPSNEAPAAFPAAPSM